MTIKEDDSVQVDFQEPQSGVTPGQAAVFYDGDRVLGGGWILEANGASCEVRNAAKPKL
jgi:tRNA U34 2-thiouridine synthase MnmA/TrmU